MDREELLRCMAGLSAGKAEYALEMKLRENIDYIANPSYSKTSTNQHQEQEILLTNGRKITALNNLASLAADAPLTNKLIELKVPEIFLQNIRLCIHHHNKMVSGLPTAISKDQPQDPFLSASSNGSSSNSTAKSPGAHKFSDFEDDEDTGELYVISKTEKKAILDMFEVRFYGLLANNTNFTRKLSMVNYTYSERRKLVLCFKSLMAILLRLDPASSAHLEVAKNIFLQLIDLAGNPPALIHAGASQCISIALSSLITQIPPSFAQKIYQSDSSSSVIKSCRPLFELDLAPHLSFLFGQINTRLIAAHCELISLAHSVAEPTGHDDMIAVDQVKGAFDRVSMLVECFISFSVKNRDSPYFVPCMLAFDSLKTLTSLVSPLPARHAHLEVLLRERLSALVQSLFKIEQHQIELLLQSSPPGSTQKKSTSLITTQSASPSGQKDPNNAAQYCLIRQFFRENAAHIMAMDGIDVNSNDIIDLSLSLNMLSLAFATQNKALFDGIADFETLLSKLSSFTQSQHCVVQRGAVNLLVSLLSDKTSCTQFLLSGGLNAVGLISSPDIFVAARALVLLSKVTSMDVNSSKRVTQKLFEEADSDINLLDNLFSLAKTYFLDAKLPLIIRKWALESLAYLALDARAKEKIAFDKPLIEFLVRISPTANPDKSALYMILTIFRCLINAFEKEKVTEEQEKLQELQKLAKQDVQETQPLDEPQIVQKRLQILVDHGFICTIVLLYKHLDCTPQMLDVVASILHCVANTPANRALLVAAGAHLVLLEISTSQLSSPAQQALELTRTDNPKANLPSESLYKTTAAQALAKITISCNPNTAFQGETAKSLVRPLLALTKSTYEVHIFEALLALTNLASMNDHLRKKILLENGIAIFYDLQFDENKDIQRAATEVLVNMLMLDEVFDLYTTESGKRRDDIKLWVSLAGDENDNPKLNCAAAAGLAMMSQESQVCDKIVSSKVGLQVLKELLARDFDTALRAIYVISNLVNSTKANAAAWVESENSIEVLVALIKLYPGSPISKLSNEILGYLTSIGLIKSNA